MNWPKWLGNGLGLLSRNRPLNVSAPSFHSLASIGTITANARSIRAANLRRKALAKTPARNTALTSRCGSRLPEPRGFMVFRSMMKFNLGRLVIAPAVLASVSVDDICRAFDRHVCGVWGDVPDLVRITNEIGLGDAGALRSAYRSPNGTELRVLTAANRLTTTVHLPSESGCQRTPKRTPSEL
jgi:hypothetical protein